MSRILLVEDETALLDLYADVVGDLGFEVILAHDGEEALALARAQRPAVIVSDHMMPRMTGLELLRAIRADPALAATTFILISAALPRGADEADVFLGKPIGLELLERTIVEAAEQACRPAPRPAEGPRISRPAAHDGELARIAHECRTPLASARMNLEIVQRRLADGDPAVGSRIAAALDQLERLEAKIRNTFELPDAPAPDPA